MVFKKINLGLNIKVAQQQQQQKFYKTLETKMGHRKCHLKS